MTKEKEMKNGTYTITNPSNQSKLVVLLQDSKKDEISIVQLNSKGEHTAQQCRTRKEAEIAVERAMKNGMKVEYAE